LLAGYFTYAYQQFSEAMKPPQLVGLVQGMVEENIPQMRMAVEEQITKSAPLWAADLSQKAIVAMPDGRKQLEKHILEQFDQSVEQAMSVSDDQLRAFFRTNKAVLDEEFAALANDPAAAKQRISKLVQVMDGESGVPLKQQSEELFKMLISMNEKIARLEKGVNLGPEEQLEQRVLLLGRRLQKSLKAQEAEAEVVVEPPAERS
jgi:hypothetical protein